MCYYMTTTLEVDYENPWIYEGRPFTSDDIGDYYGFVYCITNTTTGQKYIGRKYFVQKRKPKGGKRRVTSESDWKRYYGSSDELKRDIKENGRDSFKTRNPLPPHNPWKSKLRRDKTVVLTQCVDGST